MILAVVVIYFVLRRASHLACVKEMLHRLETRCGLQYRVYVRHGKYAECVSSIEVIWERLWSCSAAAARVLQRESNLEKLQYRVHVSRVAVSRRNI